MPSWRREYALLSRINDGAGGRRRKYDRRPQWVAASAIVGLLGCEGEVLSKTIIPVIGYFTIAGLVGIVFV
jgi:hypothetical protein